MPAIDPNYRGKILFLSEDCSDVRKTILNHNSNRAAENTITFLHDYRDAPSSLTRFRLYKPSTLLHTLLCSLRDLEMPFEFTDVYNRVAWNYFDENGNYISRYQGENISSQLDFAEQLVWRKQKKLLKLITE